jgi:fibronectin-binding autotransporter adhesin
VTFPGAISGTGSVNQIGTGSTTLAANTYSGGTLLAAGTLIAGDNSAFGTGALTVGANAAGTTLDNTPAATILANAIVLNPSANLTVAGSNPLTLAGVISGNGALTKNGASTLILTADNSYAGGTTINAGILQVGNGGASGSVGTGPVLDDAALVFNRSGIVICQIARLSASAIMPLTTYQNPSTEERRWLRPRRRTSASWSLA